MEDQFAPDLRVLTNALRQDGFRFILIGHNRKSIYTDIATYLRNAFPDRAVNELSLRGKSYRTIIDSVQAVQQGILLIPDFDWLFLDENNDLRVAFNQRRDLLARLPIALICFIEPGSYINVPAKIPDWWSLRSMELDFHRELSDPAPKFSEPEQKASSLGGQTRGEREAEIKRLSQQIADADPENKPLLGLLYGQIATLYYELASYEIALTYLEQSLAIQQAIGDRRGEGITLNNMGVIYFRHLLDMDNAVICFTQAYQIFTKISLSNVKITRSYLNEVIGKIGEARYKEILQRVGNVPRPDRS